jgi:hypothetical protein
MAPTRFFLPKGNYNTRAGGVTMSGIMMKAAALSAALLAGGFAQGPQELAEKLSGTWVMNRDLSTGFAAPARGRGGEPRLARSGAPFATAAPVQRGGGGGGDASDLTPEQRAEQAAMRQLQQIESRITIKASATEVTFIDSRGEQTFAINDKAATVLKASAPVKVKLKWDKQALKQEFSNSQAKLVQTWSVDATNHLVMTAKIESLTLVTPERRAVFDRQ